MEDGKEPCRAFCHEVFNRHQCARDFSFTPTAFVYKAAHISRQLRLQLRRTSAVFNDCLTERVRQNGSPKEEHPMSLELRPNCECCNCDLPPDSNEAYICTFECTYS